MFLPFLVVSCLFDVRRVPQGLQFAQPCCKEQFLAGGEGLPLQTLVQEASKDCHRLVASVLLDKDLRGDCLEEVKNLSRDVQIEAT